MLIILNSRTDDSRLSSISFLCRNALKKEKKIISNNNQHKAGSSLPLLGLFYQRILTVPLKRFFNKQCFTLTLTDFYLWNSNIESILLSFPVHKMPTFGLLRF